VQTGLSDSDFRFRFRFRFRDAMHTFSEGRQQTDSYDTARDSGRVGYRWIASLAPLVRLHARISPSGVCGWIRSN